VTSQALLARPQLPAPEKIEIEKLVSCVTARTA